jgi:ankyrin repeat protein
LVASIFGAYWEYKQEIHSLLGKGEIEKAKALLIKDPTLKNVRNDRAPLHRTPLHVAVVQGQVDLVKLLLKLGADVNALDNGADTPLHLTDDPAIAKLLIDSKADLEAKNPLTPTEYAAFKLRHVQPAAAQKFRAVIKVLLDSGAYYSIWAATYLDDLDRVKAILKDDPKLALDKHLLVEAATWGHIATVKLLLDYKADPNTTTEFDHHPVLYLAQQHPDIVRLLIKAGADPKVSTEEIIKGNWGNREKMTLLHHAAKKGLVEMAKLLIEGGADINSRGSEYDRTPLEVAAKNGHPEMVKLLLKNKASVRDNEGLQVMKAAVLGVDLAFGSSLYLAKTSMKELMDILVNYRAVITVLGEAGVPISLEAAVALGDVSRLQKMLKDQPPLASSFNEGNRFLFLAVNLNQKEMVTALLDAGVPINSRGNGMGWTALHMAVSGNKEELVKLLIDRKADVNARCGGVTPLHYAAMKDRPTVAKILLNAKTDVNIKDEDSRTPLHYAARLGKADVVKMLLEAGTDVNAKDKDGTTPLHLLAARHVYGDIRTDDYERSLEEARQNIRTIAEILFEAKAEVNAMDNTGATPLHKTTTGGSNKDMAEILLAAGADVNARDKNSKTPLALIPRYDTKMIALFIKHGGER